MTFMSAQFTKAFTLAGALAACFASAALAQGRGGSEQGGDPVEPLTTELVADGLVRPIIAAHAPGDFTRLFIVEKEGRIRVLNLKTGQVLATPFLDIDSIVGGGNSANDERGLLGLAFHPDYQDNGWFYVNYTGNDSDTRIARYSVSDDPDVADPGSGEVLLEIDQPQSNHNGGWIDFGLDNHLYIATGDGGNFCDTGFGHTSGTGNALDITNNLLGKILRFAIDDTGDLVVPDDNPFVGQTGDDEIWAYGLRNPWRSSFDRETGDLYIGDVGQGAREEVSFVAADSNGGENFGWRCQEGFIASSASGCSQSNCGSLGPFDDPIHDYPHISSPFRCAITGGYVYRGCAIPSFEGHYVFADFCSNEIWTFEFVSNHVTNLVERSSELNPPGALSISSITGFAEDARGEIYICDQNGGEVFKIVPEDPTIAEADFDCSGAVGVADLLQLLAAWGPCDGCLEDLDGDAEVGVSDLLSLLNQWG